MSATAHATTLLESEFLPKPQFYDRVLGLRNSGGSARLLTSVGQDVVETLINEQTEKRLFVAMGLDVRAGLELTERVRFDASALAIRSSASTQVGENSGWRKTEAQSEIVGRGHARLKLNEGIAAGVGVVWVNRPAAQESFDFAGQSAVKRLSAFSILSPDFSLSKDAGGWTAGLGWRPRATQQRKFTREGAGETVSISEEFVLDELWSAAVSSQLASDRRLSLEFSLTGAAVAQESQTASTSSSSDASIEDKTRRRYSLAILYALGEFLGHRLTLGGGYQSIGYADQAYVSSQSIPLWSLVVRDEFKAAELNVFLDSTVGYGSDLQSLPDLNAKYRRVILSVQSGVQF